jgi:hypothetical protein
MLRPDQPKRLTAGSKRAAVLKAMLERGAHGLNCFEAVTVCHDYVLRSTIADLQREHGFTFPRTWEQVAGHAGSKVECVRYRLSAEDVAKARALLGMGSPATTERSVAQNAFQQAEMAV